MALSEKTKSVAKQALEKAMSDTGYSASGKVKSANPTAPPAPAAPPVPAESYVPSGSTLGKGANLLRPSTSSAVSRLPSDIAKRLPNPVKGVKESLEPAAKSFGKGLESVKKFTKSDFSNQMNDLIKGPGTKIRSAPEDLAKVVGPKTATLGSRILGGAKAALPTLGSASAIAAVAGAGAYGAYKIDQAAKENSAAQDEAVRYTSNASDQNMASIKAAGKAAQMIRQNEAAGTVPKEYDPAAIQRIKDIPSRIAKATSAKRK